MKKNKKITVNLVNGSSFSFFCEEAKSSALVKDLLEGFELTVNPEGVVYCIGTDLICEVVEE